MDKFIVSSNTALELKLIRKTSDINDSKMIFYPEMTYQLFGNVEKIFGYKDLVVKMYYAACSLKLYINISYSSKIDSEVYDLNADDIMEKLKNYITPNFISNIDVFEKCLEDEPLYKPYGNQLYQFNLNNKGKENVFEIYVIKQDSKKFKDFFNQLQTFVLWYIDSSNFIDFDDYKWKIFMIYEQFKNENGIVCYAPVGYASIYEYYAYPDKIRPRISQVLILPPFQKNGLCAKLIDSIYKHYSTKLNVIDITVESPNDEFQVVRDFVDVANFHNLKTFNKEKFKQLQYQEMVEEFKELYKVNQKQIRRVLEIILLKFTNRSNTVEYEKYKIFVKTRLNLPFKKKPTKLMLLLPAEVEKIEPEDNYDEVLAEYNELIPLYEKVIKRLESVHTV